MARSLLAQQIKICLASRTSIDHGGKIFCELVRISREPRAECERQLDRDLRSACCLAVTPRDPINGCAVAFGIQIEDRFAICSKVHDQGLHIRHQVRALMGDGVQLSNAKHGTARVHALHGSEQIFSVPRTVPGCPAIFADFLRAPVRTHFPGGYFCDVFQISADVKELWIWARSTPVDGKQGNWYLAKTASVGMDHKQSAQTILNISEPDSAAVRRKPKCDQLRSGGQFDAVASLDIGNPEIPLLGVS